MLEVELTEGAEAPLSSTIYVNLNLNIRWNICVCVSGGHQTQKTYRTLPFRTVELCTTDSFGSDGKTSNPRRTNASPAAAIFKEKMPTNLRMMVQVQLTDTVNPCQVEEGASICRLLGQTKMIDEVRLSLSPNFS